MARVEGDSLQQTFVHAARRYKKKLAFIDRSTNRRISYTQALIGSILLARRFKLIDEKYVGIMLPTSAGCGLATIATLLAGKTPVMINYSTGAEDNACYAQKKCGLKTIITAKALLEKVNCGHVEGMVYIEDMVASFGPVSKLRALIRTHMSLSMFWSKFNKGEPEDTAVILFTSGSEKAPKAVELSHKNLLSNIGAVGDAFKITDKDTMMSILPMFHVFGQTITFWLPLCYGMTIVTYANPLEFKNVVRVVREESPTILVGTPYFLAGYAKHAKVGDLSSLRLVAVGADKMPASLQHTYEEQHGVMVREGYGATETSPVISANMLERHKPGSIGVPVSGAEVRIIDIDTGEELPVGREGKLQVRGDLVMKGYLGDVEETALRIEGGWYETGDMGLIDEDGFIWHRGRLKRFIKIGGEMVSLVQVEDVLSRFLPGDASCCAVEVPDAKRGAMVGIAVDCKVYQSGLMSSLADHLPALALPRHIVVLEDLPKMGSGKVDFRTTTQLVIEYLNK
jgi:acyl-[acyl-carrier-protein]-phospholipid O-acyltransferase/long-chain-fatty-acid--[acyl-carrier-protein] ligase